MSKIINIDWYYDCYDDDNEEFYCPECEEGYGNILTANDYSVYRTGAIMLECNCCDHRWVISTPSTLEPPEFN